jgi:hypothetical protein
MVTSYGLGAARPYISPASYAPRLRKDVHPLRHGLDILLGIKRQRACRSHSPLFPLPFKSEFVGILQVPALVEHSECGLG